MVLNLMCNSWSWNPFLLLRSHISLLCSLIAITFCFLLPVLPGRTTALEFNMDNIDKNSPIVPYGTASFNEEGIQLTSYKTHQAGRATYKQQFHLYDNTSGFQANFSTTFSFVIDSPEPGSIYADGLVFFLAAPYTDFNSTSGFAIGLPIDEKTLNSTSPFVAVEFDTFNNTWDPNDTVSHVGIDINAINSPNNTVKWNSNVPQGIVNEATIVYDSTLKRLRVEFNESINGISKYRNFDAEVDLSQQLPELVDIGFAASTGSSFEKTVVKSWKFSSSSQAPNTNASNKAALVVGLSVGSFVLVGGLALAAFFLWKKSKAKEEEAEFEIEMCMDNEFETGRGPKKFSYSELTRATNNFAEEQKLGEGGFGGVYRGFLRDLNCYVAVKRISKTSKQGIKEYASEVKIISRLRHRNLVQLIGWCHEKRELLLVYEFMPNGSLDFHLFKEKGVLLTWAVRYKIAQCLASALLYLHEECEQYVVHRDIKSSNVMLDSNFNSKLGDFGLARLVDHEKVSQTTLPAGTRGYMAPEYIDTGRASKESDVYSFGIVALEIACGRKSIDLTIEEPHTKIVNWVWELFGEEKLSEAVDSNLSMDFNQQEMECLLIVGLWCAHPDRNLRPSIRQAIHVMNFEAPLPSLPTKMPIATYSAFPDPAPSTTTTATTTTATTPSSGFSNVGGGIVSENSLTLSAPR